MGVLRIIGGADNVTVMTAFNVIGLFQALNVDREDPVQAPAVRFAFNTIQKKIASASLEERGKVFADLQEKLSVRANLYQRHKGTFNEASDPTTDRAMIYSIICEDSIEDAFKDRSSGMDDDAIAKAMFICDEVKRFKRIYDENLYRRAKVDRYFEQNPIQPASRLLAHIGALERITFTDKHFDEYGERDLCDIFSKEIYHIFHWNDASTPIGQDIKSAGEALEKRMIPRLIEYTETIIDQNRAPVLP